MRIPKHLPLAVLTFSLTACTTTYYIPNTQNVPAIDAKGTTAVTLAGNADQVEFQAAYGIADGFAVQANGAWYIPRDEDNGNGGSGRLLEVGPGWFHNISDRWLFDAYGLVGFGHLENHFPTTVPSIPPTTGRIDAQLMRYALQPGITYKSRFFSASGSLRAGYLNYSNIDGSLFLDGIREDVYLADNASHFLLELALTLRGGFEKVKVQLQLVQSVNLTDNTFKQENTIVTVGLALRFTQ